VNDGKPFESRVDDPPFLDHVPHDFAVECCQLDLVAFVDLFEQTKGAVAVPGNNRDTRRTEWRCLGHMTNPPGEGFAARRINDDPILVQPGEMDFGDRCEIGPRPRPPLVRVGSVAGIGLNPSIELLVKQCLADLSLNRLGQRTHQQCEPDNDGYRDRDSPGHCGESSR